jgi:hypothetical protein
MERVRLSQRYRFPYKHRDPRKLIERFDLEAPVPGPPRKPRPIMGTETLLHRFAWLESTRRAIKHQQQELDEFLSKRLRLKTEFESFLAAGGGSVSDLKAWLQRAAQYAAEPIIKKKHLALVASNDRPVAQPSQHSTGGEAA